MRVKLAAIIVATTATCTATYASAHPYHHHHHYAAHHHKHYLAQGGIEQSQDFQPWAWSIQGSDAGSRQGIISFGAVRITGGSYEGSSGRPSDCYGIPWCGCWLRHAKGVADKALNLARNWAHWGHATTAHEGAVVVWPHHVGEIVGACSGSVCMVRSGNDGHAVRTRPRDISGVIAIRE